MTTTPQEQSALEKLGEAALAEAIQHYINSAHAQSSEGYSETIETAVNVTRWRSALTAGEKS